MREIKSLIDSGWFVIDSDSRPDNKGVIYFKRTADGRDWQVLRNTVRGISAEYYDLEDVEEELECALRHGNIVHRIG